MALTQQQLDDLAAGLSVDFGLPADPGPLSANGIFFQNVFFRTATGDSGNTAQGLLSLTVTDDVSNYNRDNTSFVVRNATLNVGDDFGVTFGTDSLLSISGPNAVLNMPGQTGGNSTRFRMVAEEGQTTSGTAYISDGAQVTIDNPTADQGRGLAIGVNWGAFDRGDGTIAPGGQSVEAALVVEGAGTQVSILNTAGGTRGSLDIGAVYQPEDGLIDPTSNRSAEGLMIVRDGASVDVHNYVGIGITDGVAGASASGALIVEGTDTSVTVNESRTAENGFIRIGGVNGEAAFVLRDGAEFLMYRGTLYDAGVHVSGKDTEPGGNATAIITGSGTHMLVEDGFFEVGRNVGTASLTISDGALFEAQRIQTAMAGTAETVIEGAGTRVELSDGTDGSLNIARVNFEDTSITEADGIVTIRDGAEVNVRSFIGLGDAEGRTNPDVNGTLIVEGAGTIVTVGSEDRTGYNGFMRIADEGANGTFILRDGAEFHLLAGDEYGGGIQMSGASDREGGNASALITGSGTRLVAEQDWIAVGRNSGGTSDFTVSDGAVVESLFLTSGAGGEGHTVVEGSGTQLNLSGAQVVNPEFGAFLTVGRDAVGSFTLRDGASLTIVGDGGDYPGFQAGRNDGGIGVFTATGAGTTVVIDGANNVEDAGGETGFIRAGRDDGSNGMINVLDGATVTNETTGRLIVAENVGSIGKVNVDGSGSVFDFGAFAFLSSDAPGARGDAMVTISNGGTFRGGEVNNNGILDITSGGVFAADLIQDNILRSSAGIENMIIDGDLTALTGGYDFDYVVNGTVLTHDTYTATGHVQLEGNVTIIADSLADLGGFEVELITGASLGVSDGFFVQVVEFDAAAITEVDMPALIDAAANAVTVDFSTTATSLIVDFGLNEIDGNPTSQTITGTERDDFIRAFGGNDSVDAGGGDDVVDGGFGFDTLVGGAGNDRLNGQQNADYVVGGEGNDTLIGLDGTDRLEGGAGNDDLDGGVGADRLFGGDGDDLIRAGSNFGISVDGVEGGAGNDTIFGDGGFDLLLGGAGDDQIDGGAQADDLRGEDGNDTLDGGAGFDRLFGGNGDDLLMDFDGFGGLFGQNGNDTIQNGDAAVNIFGGAGNDLIEAGGGNDNITANAGFDTLNGGAGDDTLRGSFNADTFVFADGDGNDVVLDFDALNALEKIDLSAVTSITSLADLDLASAVNGAATQSGANVVIDTGSGNSVTLLNVSLSDLDAGDFLF